MNVANNVEMVIKNTIKNDWVHLDDHSAILLHSSTAFLNELAEESLSIVAENVLEYLDKIPLRSPIDNDFKTWWIDAYEYIIFDKDLIHDIYHDLGGREFFENRLKTWFKEHSFHPEIGIYHFFNDSSPTLDYVDDNLFDLYTLFHEGNLSDTIWKENFCSNKLTSEEIESLKHISIKDLNAFNTYPLISSYSK